MSCARWMSLGVAVVILVGCAPATEPVPEVPVRIACTGLGVALTSVPEPFELVSNDEAGVSLTTAGGKLTMTATEPDVRLNLVAMVEDRMAIFKELEGGQWFGRQELGTMFGPAFTARGSRPEGEGRVEELWVYALHPDGDRALVMQYTYPAGEGGERAPQVLSVLGEVEAL